MPRYFFRRSVVCAFLATAAALSVAETVSNFSSAAGIELARPERQDQPDKPAEQVYKNIQLFKGVPAGQMMKGMDFITKWLGVDCNHCHVEGALEKENKPSKQATRRMFQMVRAINGSINSSRVTCYTCHRGTTPPGPDSFTPPSFKPVEGKAEAGMGTKTAEQAYKNIQVMKSEPASNWMTMMSFMAASLGVDCTYCHVQDKFESDDKPQKQTARKMLQMVQAVGSQFYGKELPISCYTCHRGKPTPLSMPPDPVSNKRSRRHLLSGQTLTSLK